MKIIAVLRRLNSLIVATGLVSLLGAGCSGSQEDEEKLDATEEKSEEPKEEEAAPATDESKDESPDESSDDASVAEPEPTPVAEVPSAPAPTATVDKARVVRYINKDEVLIHGQPNDKAEPVGKLMKGDMILVIENDGWGKISDNMFIKVDALTKKAVPRNRNPAVWGKPTH